MPDLLGLRAPAALGVRARRARQGAKQTLHAVKLRGGDAFLYDVATAKSASTETSSVGSSALRERRPLATELVSVENRLDAAGIPHTPLSHVPSLATELVSVENRLDAERTPHTPHPHAPLATELVSMGGGGQPTCGPRVVQNHTFQRAGIHPLRPLVGGNASFDSLAATCALGARMFHGRMPPFSVAGAGSR